MNEKTPKFIAFVSRHLPTDAQFEMAAEQGLTLLPLGDRDAFTLDVEQVIADALPVAQALYPGADVSRIVGICVVHPAAALRAAQHQPVYIFENANRAAEGEPPKFLPVALHKYG